MAKRKGSGTPSRAKGGNPGIRAGSVRQRITNSGLEVWLYDDANRKAIRNEKASDPGFGGMPGNFETLTRRGLVVGYSLMQDDELDVAVLVGGPLTESELSAARWLEPQTAFLRLPSGRLCIESKTRAASGPRTRPPKVGSSTCRPAIIV